MSENGFGRQVRTHAWQRAGTTLCLLLVPLCCAADADPSPARASARLRFTVVIPPVFRVLQVTPTPAGYEYRVWTNTRSILLNGRAYRFPHVGETTLTLPPSAQGMFIVHGL